MSTLNMINNLETAMNKAIREEIEERANKIADELTKEFEERLEKEKITVINNVSGRLSVYYNRMNPEQEIEFVVRHKFDKE